MGTINSHPPTANSPAFQTSPTTTTVMGPSISTALPQNQSILELKNSGVDSTPCNPSMRHPSGLEREGITASPVQALNNDMQVNIADGSQVVSNGHHQDPPGAEIQVEGMLIHAKSLVLKKHLTLYEQQAVPSKTRKRIMSPTTRPLLLPPLPLPGSRRPQRFLCLTAPLMGPLPQLPGKR